MKQEQYIFDAKMSQSIKGVAIIIMVFHHLFGSLDWVLEGNWFVSVPLGESSLEYYVAVFGKVCISVYAFLSGYGLYTSYQHKKQNIFNVIKRVLFVLLNWWLIVLFCFVPLALICKQQISYKELLGNLFLVENTWCPFADYLLFYVTAIITFPFIYWLLNKVNSPVVFFIGTPLLGMVLRKVVDWIIPQGIFHQLLYFYFLYIAFVVAGSCVCQSGVFLKLHNWLSEKRWNNVWFNIFFIFLLIPIRWLLGNKLICDSFFATVLVFFLVELLQGREKRFIFRVLQFLGKHSTNIWFLHAAFFFSFAEYTQRIVYFLRVPLLIMVWCLACCIPFSWIINLLHNKILGIIIKKKKRTI